MYKWLKIAVRNIFKNKRRSLVTLLAIAMGFAAVSLFSGYTSYVYKGMRRSAIHGEGLGHLTIYKKGWEEHGRIDPERYMFRKDELKKLISLVDEDADVDFATPQLHVSGLVSNGKVSTIFLGQGVVPEEDQRIHAPMGKRKVEGVGLASAKEWQVEMAKDLARQLDLQVGGDAVVMGATLDGQMNALDISTGGIYDTGTAATNDKYIRMSFAAAQSFYDTDMADRVVVLLHDWQKTPILRDRLLQKLKANGLDVEIKTWEELSSFYLQVRNLFGMIFLFIFCIVFVIVVMSVVNTMGMAVVERTREIGTLRALGLKRSGVNLLFALEGGVLGFLGSLGGIVIFTLVWGLFDLVHPSYIPPGSSSPVPLRIEFVPQMILLLLAFLSLLSVLAAILPARRAGRQQVVDALAHV